MSPVILFQLSHLQQPLWPGGSNGVTWIKFIVCVLTNKNTRTSFKKGFIFMFEKSNHFPISTPHTY